MRALLSVYNRDGIVDFARALHRAGFELVSTGGTGQHLADAGLPVTQVSDVIGFPEILDGRVKTLHPKIHGGILARRDLPDHREQLARHEIAPIDFVVGNLYPFVETVSRDGVTLQDALEQIDIGGPTLIRAAAKTFPDVAVVVDPSDYGWIGERLDAAAGGKVELSQEERRGLARKAFQHVAWYDTAVVGYLGDGARPAGDEITFGYTKLAELRYGENPHQEAAVYGDALSAGGIVRAEQLHGGDMSFTNFLDADAAWGVVSDFDAPAAAVIKHTNPCGLAVHDDQPTAYRRAFEGDSMSAYGGIVGFNRTVTAATAEAMRGVLYHIIVAPDYESEALDILRKRKQLRILRGRARRRAVGSDGRAKSLRRRAGAERGRSGRRPRRLEGRDRAASHGERVGGPGVRLEGGQAHQVQHDRARQGQHAGRYGRRSAEPGDERPPCAAYRGREGQGKLARLGRLHALRGQRRDGRRGRSRRHRAAGRVDQGRRSHSGGGPAGHGDGVHRRAPLQALRRPSPRCQPPWPS